MRRCSLRTLFHASVVFLASLNVVVLFTYLQNRPTVSKWQGLPAYLRGVRGQNLWPDGDDTKEESCCDWHKKKYKNDETFSDIFKTIGSKEPFDECRKKNATLVLCVLSHPSRSEIRNAIRSTWANSSLVSMENVALWFIGGNSTDSTTASGEADLVKESGTFGDVVIGNFKDTQKNSTLKVLFALYYVIMLCPSVVDVYVGMDDTYVNIPHLLKHLKYEVSSGKREWRGFLRPRMKPEREEKSPFYISRQEFREEVYPDFCSLNNGFVLPASSLKDLLFAARNETLVKFPDVYLGILSSLTRVRAVADPSFGSQALTPNIQACKVRQEMSSFTYIGNHENLWKELVDADRLRKCVIPDVDVFLRKSTDNTNYFGKVLKYLLNNQTVCSTNDGRSTGVFIISLISSHANHFEQREAIRQTWASQKIFYGRHIRHVFVLGKVGGWQAAETKAMVAKESAEYGDIVQGDFLESFRNLTLKVVLGLKWTSEYCPGATYLYKGDEDMFVAWKNIVRFLLETSDKAGKEKLSRFFLGSKMAGSRRISNPASRYFVNESNFPGDYYPMYCSGGSYLMSNDIVPELFKKSLRSPLIPIDDAYQGLLTEQIGVHPIHYQGFRVFFNMKDCDLQKEDTLTLHGFKSPKSLMDVWSNYQAKKECLQ